MDRDSRRIGATVRSARRLAAIVLTLLIVPVAASLSGLPAASAAVVLPAGFSLNPIATGQPERNLSNFEFLPGGGVMLMGRNGLLTVVSGDGPPRTLTTLPEPVSTLDVGAIGLTLAPDYATTGKLYTFYIRNTPAGRVLRISAWTASPPGDPTTLADERTIIEAPQTSGYHGGGTVLVAPDGNLLISIGDD